MNTILILAYECYPFNRPGSTIGAQRPYQFAKHLPKFGFRTIVLCCDYNARWRLSVGQDSSTIPNIVENSMRDFNREGSVIIPLPSYKHNGFWDKVWLSTVEIDNNLGTFRPKGGFFSLCLRKVSTFCNLFIGDYSQSWQRAAEVASEQIIQQISINFILAEHSPDASVYVARNLFKKHAIPWGVDFRDPLLAPYKRGLRALVHLHFRRILRTSSIIFNVNPYWTKLDKEKFGRPVGLVTNGFDRDEFDFPEAVIEKDQDFFHLFYFGSVKDGQSFKVLFEALKLYHNLNHTRKIQLTYYGPSGSLVTQQANETGVSKHVKIHALVPRERVLAEAMKADALVLLSKINKDEYFRKGFYPGKVFEYFAFKKNIICVPGDNGQLDELLNEVNVGKSFSDPNKLAEYLEQLVLHPLNFKSEIRNTDQYTRQFQAYKLSVFLTNILKKKENDFKE